MLRKTHSETLISGRLSAFKKWAVIGGLMGCFLAWAQASAVGGLTGMLQVGETSNLRPLIEAQLGEIPLADGPGHDGQIYYAIALDLTGDEVGPLLDHAAYRYRRILSPTLSSVFGVLDGESLLWMQLLLGILSMGLASGMVAAMSDRSGKSDLLALTVVLNPGVWLSVQLLTPDAFALALMISGFFAWTLAHENQSSAWFTLSTLAKDVDLASPLPLGLSRRSWKVAVIPPLVLGTWMMILQLRFGEGFSSRGNLDWPFAGMIEASGNWTTLDTPDLIYLVFALASVAVGVYSSIRGSWLRWPIAVWTALALISSNWVWDFGNNAARAFSPLVVLIALAAAQPATATAEAASRRVAS